MMLRLPTVTYLTSVLKDAIIILDETFKSMPFVKPGSPPKVTLKQRRFVKKYLETGNAKKAYRHAYDTKTENDGSVAVMAKRMLDSKGTQHLLARAFEREGLTEDKLASDWSRLRRLTMPTEPVKDPRLNFDMMKEEAKIRGWYAAEKKEIKKQTANLNVDLKGKTPEDLDSLLGELTEKLKGIKKIAEEAKRFKDAEVLP